MEMKIAAEPNTQKEETGKYTILTKCKNKFLRKIQKRTEKEPYREMGQSRQKNKNENPIQTDE